MVSKKLVVSLILVLSTLLTAFTASGQILDPVEAFVVAATPTPAAAPGAGAGDNSEHISPLTGLAVEDATLLGLPPVLVSVTNFPVSARPQAGLSFSPYVFEMFIGNGMTRFLAMFHGSYPQVSTPVSTTAGLETAAIGPVRSGRLPYEGLRKLYNGLLVTTGASSEVGAVLSESATVYGSDKNNVNSAFLDVTRLETIAKAGQKSQAGSMNLGGNVFDAAVPAGGKAAGRAWVFYNFYNQIEWLYDAATGAYLRSQDKADATGKFYPATDRLTGEQLAFENVVVLFADHKALSSSLIDVNFMYTTKPALLFRDGQVYKLNWTTANGDYEKQTGKLRPIRFVDASGKPFPMKPGQTWVQIVTSYTAVQELSPGNWKVRFYAP